jgi:hypothetical protein
VPNMRLGSSSLQPAFLWETTPLCASFCAIMQTIHWKCAAFPYGTTVAQQDASCFGRAMWTRSTALIVVLALAASIAVGAPLHSSERGCNAANAEMTDCEHMGMERGSPAATGMALCCMTDCQQPGPVGSGFTLSIPTFSATVLPAAHTPPPTRLRPLPQERQVQSSSFSPPNCYLKNLALLI